MSATPLIDGLKKSGSICGWVFGERVAYEVTESQLSALVAEQVALAVAEYKKDAERYNKLIKHCGFGLRKNGVVELNILLPGVDHIGQLSKGLDEIAQRGLIL